MSNEGKDALEQDPALAAIYQGAMQDWVITLCKKLSLAQARMLENSWREHEGLIVFADKSGGVSFQVKITFRDVMTHSEVMSLVGALAEKHGPSGPVTWAGNAETAAEVFKKVRG